MTGLYPQEQNAKLPIAIRAAQSADIKGLCDLSDVLGNGKSEDYFLRQLGYVGQGLRTLYVASCDGADVGYCILNWRPKYAPFRKFSIPEIQDINVAQDYRQRGIATQMIAFCEDAARARGLEEMGIGVSVNSQFAPAQRLYVKLGYIPDGNGVTYDRKTTVPGEFKPLDDQLCLMMVKGL